MEEVRTGQIRTAWHEGQPRSVEIICSSHNSPGYWLVQDLKSGNQFMLPNVLLVKAQLEDRPLPDLPRIEEGPAPEGPILDAPPPDEPDRPPP